LVSICGETRSVNCRLPRYRKLRRHPQRTSRSRKSLYPRRRPKQELPLLATDFAKYCRRRRAGEPRPRPLSRIQRKSIARRTTAACPPPDRALANPCSSSGFPRPAQLPFGAPWAPGFGTRQAIFHRHDTVRYPIEGETPTPSPRRRAAPSTRAARVPTSRAGLTCRRWWNATARRWRAMRSRRVRI